MKYLFAIRVSDIDSQFSDDEIRQVENMIWLRLGAIKEQVLSAALHISRYDHYRYGSEFAIRISIKLKSGKVIESINSGYQKKALLLLTVTQIEELAKNRVCLESSWLYRATDQLKYRFVNVLNGASPARPGI